MTRPWQIGAIFLVCLVVVLGALAWTSYHVLRLDRMEAEIAVQNLQEDNIRLALWRMESMLTPLIAQEASRPYFEYSAFYPTERAYTRMFGQLAPGDVLLPSPILAKGSSYVLLNFQIGPDGEVTSPQAPTGQLQHMAESGLTTRDAIQADTDRLAQLRPVVSGQVLVAALPKPEVLPLVTTMVLGPVAQEQQEMSQQTLVNAGRNFNVDAQQLKVAQQQRGQNEYVARNRAQFENNTLNPNSPANTVNNDGNLRFNGKMMVPETDVAPSAGDVREGLVKAVWIGDKLLLARRVSVGGSEYVQGAWLDWDMLRRNLLENVQDLLPQASLVPATGSPRPPRDHVAPRSSVDFGRGSSSYGAAAYEPERLLAALPVRLVPVAPLLVEPEGPSILIVSLAVAWIGVILAGVAVAVLLWQAVSLSERRAAFVSAVTHELRTPLTTFRMYSEMLAGNMVTDEAKRHRYLDTLRIEANRLTHLVENVLSYARLERNKTRGRSEIVRMDNLVSRVEQRLSERAAQAGMQLATEMSDAAGAASVRADVSAVEQILFNLIDNACKYAVTATDKRLHLVIDANGGGRVRLKVCDHGPGISAHDGRRLFRPFTKSARDAASSAPGVGLGLALSRRLAREMGGDLVLVPPTPDGACFILTLPVA